MPEVIAAPSASTAPVTSFLVSSSVTRLISLDTAAVALLEAIGARAAFASAALSAVPTVVPDGAAVGLVDAAVSLVTGKTGVASAEGWTAAPSIFATTDSAACSTAATALVAKWEMAENMPCELEAGIDDGRTGASLVEAGRGALAELP